jgi:hypothetical protein
MQKRVAEATGVSERTITGILKEWEEHEQVTSFGMPGKKHNVHKQMSEIDSFFKCVVQRNIQFLHTGGNCSNNC